MVWCRCVEALVDHEERRVRVLVSSPLFGALVLVFCSACDTGGRRSRQAGSDADPSPAWPD